MHGAGVPLPEPVSAGIGPVRRSTVPLGGTTGDRGDAPPVPAVAAGLDVAPAATAGTAAVSQLAIRGSAPPTPASAFAGGPGATPIGSGALALLDRPGAATLIDRVAGRVDIAAALRPSLPVRTAVAPPAPVPVARRLGLPVGAAMPAAVPATPDVATLRRAGAEPAAGRGGPPTNRPGGVAHDDRSTSGAPERRAGAPEHRAGDAAAAARRTEIRRAVQQMLRAGLAGDPMDDNPLGNEVIRRSFGSPADRSAFDGPSSAMQYADTEQGDPPMPAYDRLHGVYGPDTVVRRFTIGSHRNTPRPSGNAAPEVAVRSPNGLTGQQILEALLTPEVFDELVDRVVDRIERRVLDELERRGERNVPGVF